MAPVLLPQRPRRRGMAELPADACVGKGGYGRGMCKPVQPPMACWDEGSPPPEPITPASIVRRKTASTDSSFARRLQEEFNNEVAEKEAKERFECQICFSEQRLEEGVSLDCSHIVCADCFAGFLKVKIREKCVSEQELVCPMPKCYCPISEFQVMGVMAGTPLWDRFLETRAELYRPECPGEKHCRCPCGEVIIVTQARGDEGFVNCPGCKEKVCYLCQERHAGVSCASYWQWRKENDTSQQAFEKLMSDQGWKKCPVCKAPCERSYGCNFMTCASQSCRNKGKTNFCYICGDQLTEIEHFTHFPDGMFRDACLNRRQQAGDHQPDFWLNLWRMMQG
eukprot:TRINITY_DN113604_c0_g1_i1.p1 TRINITY_DN113604_c0_g1~~TRINITY_DN113604_c0_g1_i1.p1  ORF type:complete len:363 (-),score=71.72 TRINITY_DN113604_c0_g1_i1:225-1238(-)